MMGMDKAAGLLAAAERVVVFTGAGVSAESGIPTFRDALTGLWSRFDAQRLATPEAFRDDPDLVWGWYEWRRAAVQRVEPNAGHRAIAAIERCIVVTQNVDDLHERAGSSPVHHLHGSLFKFRCATCDLPYTGVLPEMPEPALEVEPPSCDHCGGLIRPDIVWFGEALPEEPWQRAVEATTAADVLVVVGTSGIVYPAAGLPELAVARGTVVVEVNPEPTPLSSSATITIRESASTALPTLMQRLPALLN
jgi:NAD-dependent deacetylase